MVQTSLKMTNKTKKSFIQQVRRDSTINARKASLIDYVLSLFLLQPTPRPFPRQNLLSSVLKRFRQSFPILGKGKYLHPTTKNMIKGLT